MLTALGPSGPGALATVDYPEPPQLQALIPAANAMYSPSGMHITFVLHLTDLTNDLTWHCTHRYSAFRNLHNNTGKHFVAGKLFPPLLYTNKGNRTKSEIEQRRKKLELYMGALLEAIFAVGSAGTGRSSTLSNGSAGGVGSNNSAGVPFHRVAKILQFLEYPFVDQWDDILKMSAESEVSSTAAGNSRGVSMGSTVSSVSSSSGLGTPAGLAGSFGNIINALGGGGGTSSTGGSTVGNTPGAGGGGRHSGTGLGSGKAGSSSNDAINGSEFMGDDDLEAAGEFRFPDSAPPAGSFGLQNGLNYTPSFDTQSVDSSTTLGKKSTLDRANPPDHQPITSIKSQWRKPPHLPGHNLGIALPFASLLLTIDGEWEVNVRGDKGTKRGQLRHRYDELTALCEHIAGQHVLPEVKSVQDFIASFRRKHPLASYLRVDSMVQESSRVSQRSSHLSDEGGATGGASSSPNSSEQFHNRGVVGGDGSSKNFADDLYISERHLLSSDEVNGEFEYEDGELEGIGSMCSSTRSSLNSYQPDGGQGGQRSSAVSATVRASDGTLDVKGRKGSGLQGGRSSGTHRRRKMGPNSKHYNLQGELAIPKLPASATEKITEVQKEFPAWNSTIALQRGSMRKIAKRVVEELPSQAIPVSGIEASVHRFHLESMQAAFYDSSLVQQQAGQSESSPGTITSPQSPNPAGALFASSASSGGVDPTNSPSPTKGGLTSPTSPGDGHHHSSSSIHKDPAAQMMTGSSIGGGHHNTRDTPLVVLEGDTSNGSFEGSPKPHVNTRRSLEPQFPGEEGAGGYSSHPMPNNNSLLQPPMVGQGISGSPSPSSSFQGPAGFAGTPPKGSGLGINTGSSSTAHLKDIKGDSVYGCRCSRAHFCVSADGTGDIYMTKSNQAIVVVPPPFIEQSEENDNGRYDHPMAEERVLRVEHFLEQQVKKQQARGGRGGAGGLSASAGPLGDVGRIGTTNSGTGSSPTTPAKKKKRPPALVPSGGSPSGGGLARAPAECPEAADNGSFSSLLGNCNSTAASSSSAGGDDAPHSPSTMKTSQSLENTFALAAGGNTGRSGGGHCSSAQSSPGNFSGGEDEGATTTTANGGRNGSSDSGDFGDVAVPVSHENSPSTGTNDGQPTTPPTMSSNSNLATVSTLMTLQQSSSKSNNGGASNPISTSSSSSARVVIQLNPSEGARGEITEGEQEE